MDSFPIWYYDEMKQIGTDYTSISEVEVYDERMQKIRNIPQEIDEIKAAVNINENYTILEIGTGTGTTAIELSKYCKNIIAIDVSPLMVEYARNKAKKHNRNNIEFYHTGFLTYNHQNHPVDVVITQLALHHLPDFWKMIALRRIHQMLCDRGILFLRDLVFPSNTEDYNALFNPFIESMKTAGDIKSAEALELHIKNEFSTLDWIIEDLLKRSGFIINRANYYNHFFATYLCSKL